MKRFPRWIPWVGLLVLGIAAAPARAQISPTPAATLDAVDIQIDGLDVIALRDEGGTAVVRLEKKEEIVWKGTRGIVGGVLTDRRFLAISTRSDGWLETRLQIAEAKGSSVELGAKVAILITPKRLFGFDGASGLISGESIGPQEAIRETGAGDLVAVVVTDRRVIGLSAGAQRLSQVKLDVHEVYESTKVLGAIASVRTSHRLFVLLPSSGVWSTQRLNLR